jgi:hypothetical protein
LAVLIDDDMLPGAKIVSRRRVVKKCCFLVTVAARGRRRLAGADQADRVWRRLGYGQDSSSSGVVPSTADGSGLVNRPTNTGTVRGAIEYSNGSR